MSDIRILYDYQNFGDQKYGGIGRYFAGLIDGIKHTPGYSYQLGLLVSDNYYIRNEKLSLENPLARAYFNAKPRRINKWNKSYSKKLIKKGEFDVFHPTNFNPYFLKLINKPYVLTVHDMIFEMLPEYFPLNDELTRNKQLTTGSADAIIAISQSTRKDLIEVMKIAPERITMIHHGMDLDEVIATEPITGLPGDYLLFVGLRSLYKNAFRFIDAAAQLMHENPSLHIVFAGGGPFQVADTFALEKSGIQDRCLQLDVSDAQLNYLYQHARAFVFPSLYEGFGYPLLEAFKNGCPVAAANASCFPEIAGDAAAYFNPYDSADIYHAIKQIIGDSNHSNSLVARGNERLKQFPIQKQISQTLDLYRKVSGK